MNQLTILDLKKIVDKLVASGEGGRVLVTSDDEEGNGFHGVFYGITLGEDYFGEYNVGDFIYDSSEKEPEKIAILG